MAWRNLYYPNVYNDINKVHVKPKESKRATSIVYPYAVLKLAVRIIHIFGYVFCVLPWRDTMQSLSSNVPFECEFQQPLPF